MKRGEIYYIYNTNHTGCEIMKGRPGIIVSNDRLNETSELLEVVYMTTSPKEDQPTHVRINSADHPSTALCEQVNTVSKLRVGDYCGTCTPEEMAALDKALLVSLGIELEPKQAESTIGQLAVELQLDDKKVALAIERLTAERDIYKELYHKLIDKAVV